MWEFLTGNSAWGYAVLFGVLVFVFEKTMYCSYVVDDVNWLKHMKEVKVEVKTGKYIKDVKSFFNLLREYCYGCGLFNSAGKEYIFNALLHFTNCCLIYRVTDNLLIPLLYLVNPINNQTAVWMNGRRYAMCCLGVLLIWNFNWLAFALFPFFAYVHVSIFALPLLFLWTKYWFFVPILMVLLIPFISHKIHIWKGRKGDFLPGNENQKLSWNKLIIYIKSVGYYFQICVFPTKPAMYHNFLFYYSATEEGNKQAYSFNFEFWKGLVILGGLIYMITFQHSFGAFWFLVFISQWCNVLQVTMNASDRYCSIPNIGVMMMLGEALVKLPQPYGLMGFVFFMTFYIMVYQRLFKAYTSVENFHLYHLEIQPDLILPRFFLAKSYLQRKDIYSAFALIKMGLRFRPNDFRFLLTMLECLLEMKQTVQAMKVMDFIEKRIPIGEEKETLNFFKGIRDQLKPEMEMIEARNKMHQKIMGQRAKNIHNNGQPIVKTK